MFFRQSTGAIGAQQNMVHNYENWTLKVNNANSDEIKTFNLLVRNKPHIKVRMNVLYNFNSHMCLMYILPIRL